MNWGKGIISGMIVFMLFIIGMCIYMFNIPVDDYDHQYYEKGLTFNKDHDREQQVETDHAQPLLIQDGDKMLITFTAPAKGSATFMRPSDNTLDQVFKLDGNQTKIATINLGGMSKGLWQLTFEWVSNRKSYLYHKEVYIK